MFTNWKNKTIPINVNHQIACILYIKRKINYLLNDIRIEGFKCKDNGNSCSKLSDDDDDVVDGKGLNGIVH